MARYVLPFLLLALFGVAPLLAAAGDCADAIRSWEELDKLLLPGAESRQQTFALAEELRQKLERCWGGPAGKAGADAWVFPLPGYGRESVRADGYFPGRYDFFDGDFCRGHPALDIFVCDRNRDCRDDRTGQPLTVVSASPGLVVAAVGDWEKSNPSRGGNRLWIYAPSPSGLFFYAHLDKLLVRLGDRVAAGTPIATLGRTGQSVLSSSAPTHLHMMYLLYPADGRPRPTEFYRFLAGAKGRN